MQDQDHITQQGIGFYNSKSMPRPRHWMPAKAKASGCKAKAKAKNVGFKAET